jgi:hypothetical protein
LVPGFCFIGQAVVVILPGRDPILVHFCAGKMDAKLVGVGFKPNAFYNFVTLVNIL